jgi:hypothetical protein
VAEKSLLEKLQTEYVAVHPALGADAHAAVSDFLRFAEKWLTDNQISGLSYTVDGMVLRMANGDGYMFVKAADTDTIGGAFSVTGMDKLNARSTPILNTDFQITGR